LVVSLNTSPAEALESGDERQGCPAARAEKRTAIPGNKENTEKKHRYLNHPHFNGHQEVETCKFYFNFFKALFGNDFYP